MKVKLIILSIVSILLLGCNDGKMSSEESTQETDTQKDLITKKNIENLEYKDYVLSTDSENEVADWEKYQELAIQISYLKKADLSFFNGDKELLKKFIEEFKTQIPDTLNANHVISRVAIVETRILRLNDDLTLDNIDEKDKLESVKEMMVAFSNLNYHINKKLVRDKNNKITSDY